VIVEVIIAGYAAIVATAAIVFQIRQARSARKPQIELELILSVLVRALQDDVVETCRVVTFDVRNRGDHPIRIVEAGIMSLKLRYEFRSQATQILMVESGTYIMVPIEVLEVEGEEVEAPPLPGIILPRDGANRQISSCMVPAQDTAKIASDVREFIREIDNSLGSDLYGWVKLSTGELVRTKSAILDWSNFGGG
jgi:hypothetical protein